MDKNILFLSALDFKDKSIQVIRKTPESYANEGWKVDYIVARDNSPNGNYFYEKEINPKGLNITRIYWPFPNLRSKLSRYTGLIFGKVASGLVIFKLAFHGLKQVRSVEYDVVYGYEMHGVLALNILRFLGVVKESKKISRFQGTFLNEMFENKQYQRVFFNLDHIFSIWLNSDLLIMTNDGTQGDQAIKKIKGNKEFVSYFWTNGVDKVVPDINQVAEMKNHYKLEDKVVLLSVSRLVGWKRVDRNLKIIKALKDVGVVNFKYLIVGDGDTKPKLECLVEELNLQDFVVFVGSVNNTEVKNYLMLADFFLSMYDSSNVGNPLLEAIRANKIICTLNNGDTGKWISNGINGLIYDSELDAFANAAKDISVLINNLDVRREMISQIRITEDERLWTWDERLKKEIEIVGELCFH